MTPAPEFDELIGQDVDAAERDRLRRVHELLVAAGPPDAFPTVARPTPSNVVQLPLARRPRLIALAAAALLLAGTAFAAGYLTRGGGGKSAEPAAPTVVRVVPMHGTAAAPEAFASLRIGRRDAAGNSPMVLVVRGLRPLRRGAYYELFLTRSGRPVAPCGGFAVAAGPARVSFTVPYDLQRFDGWIVVREQPHGQKSLRDRIVLTT